VENKHLNILILEDSPFDADMVKRVLKKSMSNLTIKVVDNGIDFQNEIKTNFPDLILSDHSLPQFSSHEALKICKEENYLNPFILVTGTVSEEFAAQCIKEGADDYILKNNLIRLPTAIYNALLKKNAERERRDAMLQLKRSEERYRQIVETAQEGIWMLDSDFKTVFVNQKLCEMFGYSQQEMMGKENTYFMDDEGKALSANSRERRMNGISEKMDICFRTKSGNRIWVNLAASPIQDGEGNFMGGLAMVADITERRLAEQRIAESEKRFRALIEKSSDFVFLLNAHGKIIYKSPSVLNHYGFTKEDLVGKDNLRFIYRDDVGKMKNLFDELLRKPGESVSFEHRRIHKNLSYSWAEGTLTNLLEDPAVAAIVFNFRDITERKQMDSLFMKVAIRAQEQERNRFAKDLHDGLGQMLTAVKLNLSGMDRESFTEDQKKSYTNAQTILGNAMREARSIAHNLTPKGLDEFGLLASLTDLFDKSASASSLQFKFQHFELSDRLNSDIELAIYRLCQEFISNTIKHAEASVVDIKIKKYKHMLVLIYEDNGKGFDTEKLLSVGSGIGLKNMESRIKSLNGSLITNSISGRGTTFCVEIPLNN